jgi:hypothetical protein
MTQRGDILPEMEEELLYGISTVTQELRKNYARILEYNSDNPSWSDEDKKVLKEEKERIETLHNKLDKKLSEGQSIENRTFVKIIREERNAEKVEQFLEEKYQNGNLKFGGKNTLKLTKSLRELSESLEVYERDIYPSIQDEKELDEQSLMSKAWSLKDIPGKKATSKAVDISEDQSVETPNGIFYFGTVGKNQSIDLDLKEYKNSDFLVVDSLGFDYKHREFREYIREQPTAGRFDYSSIISENIFRDQLPILLNDVMPTESIGKLNLSIIDTLNSKVQLGAPIIGKGVLPASTYLASEGVIPVNAAFVGAIFLKWQVLAPITITGVFLPRTLTALGARSAIFCEKIDSGFASNIGLSKPSFYLKLHIKEAPLILLFLKFPELREFTIKLHRKFGYPGLQNDYTNILKEVKFTPDGKKLPIEYKGEKKVVGYLEKEIDTGIGEVESTSSKLKNLVSRLGSLF